MLTLELIRIGSSHRGTFGVLRHGQVPFVLTLERPWLDNQQNVSCIPVGPYFCKKVKSPKFGDTFEVCNVPGRTNVLFHWGNYVEDTQGCILVGEEFSGTWDSPFIAASKRGFLELTYLVSPESTFGLVVKDYSDASSESI